MTKTKQPIAAVVCLWRHDPASRHQWALAESYANDRCSWDAWLFGRPENQDADAQEIMGRAVTLWTFEGGVRLTGFHPPDWCDWLSAWFYDELTKSPRMIEGGHHLQEVTIQEARRLLSAKSGRKER